MARSIRTRITLLAMSVTLGVCFIVCTGVYMGLHISLFREVDGFLEGEVHEFRAILIHEEDDNLAEIEREIRAELGSRRDSDLVFRLLDESGRLLITSQPDDGFPNPWQFSAGRASSGQSFETLNTNALPAPFRVCSERAQIAPHGSVVIQAAYRVDRVLHSLAICRILCICAISVAAGLSFAGGRTIARRSLMPVVEITNAAHRIGIDRLSDRVPLTGTGDELDTLAKTLNDMLKRVELSFRQIQQFTADAAHELRTPLTALRGSAEHVLAKPRSAEELRAVIEKSLDYYRLLGRVADDLLLLARLDAGQEPLQIESIDLVQMIDDLVDLYRPLAMERGIEITFDRIRPMTSIDGDSSKIRRVLSNVVDNAVKYMDRPGNVAITLNQEPGMARIEIADEGPGIPNTALPHIFERFYRADSARATDREVIQRSAGLGLSICQSLVNLHRGHISIQNNSVRGATVTIRLRHRLTA